MYRLYVDEVGTDQLVNLIHDRNRYLSLTGVAMNRDHARDFLIPRIDRIKAEIFDHDPDAPLILHRKEIMGGKGVYQRIRDDDVLRARFDDRICNVFNDAEYVVITALIDKRWMLDQAHWARRHPYNYLLEIMVEKFVQFLERKHDIGDIMPESRQGKDGLLQEEYDRIRRVGTRYTEAERITSALRGPKLKFRKKADNVAGLQLCDLLAHPSHMYVRERMGHEVQLGQMAERVTRILVDEKYDRSNRNVIKGYGYKHLPP